MEMLDLPTPLIDPVSMARPCVHDTILVSTMLLTEWLAKDVALDREDAGTIALFGNAPTALMLGCGVADGDAQSPHCVRGWHFVGSAGVLDGGTSRVVLASVAAAGDQAGMSTAIRADVNLHAVDRRAMASRVVEGQTSGPTTAGWRQARACSCQVGVCMPFATLHRVSEC